MNRRAERLAADEWRLRSWQAVRWQLRRASSSMRDWLGIDVDRLPRRP